MTVEEQLALFAEFKRCIMADIDVAMVRCVEQHLPELVRALWRQQKRDQRSATVQDSLGHTPIHSDLNTSTTKSKSKRFNNGPASASYSSEFLTFWAKYPKKQAKPIAWQSWQKHVTDPAAVMAALEWQTKGEDWTKAGGSYVPMPATYLNQHRWEDEKPKLSVSSVPQYPKVVVPEWMKTAKAVVAK